MNILDDFGKESIILENYKPLPSLKILNSNSIFEKSNEVYFGRNAPLSIILLSYAKEVKQLLGDPKQKYNFKNKSFVDKIKNTNEKYGAQIATEINAEKCVLNIVLDDDFNASSLLLITCFDNRPLDKDGNPIDGKIDLDKYVDIENIIQTKNGYKFKDSKNKLLSININIGTIWFGNEEEIAAIICHELGHCFQQGIFGSIKNYSDLLYKQEITNLNKRFDYFIKSNDTLFWKIVKLLFPLPGFFKLFSYIVSFLFQPNILNFNIFNKMNLFIHKTLLNRVVDEKRFMTKDIIDKINNDDKSANKMMRIASSNLVCDDIDREQEIEDESNDIYESYQEIDLSKKNKTSKFTQFKIDVWKFFIALALDIDNKQSNFFEFVSLSRFAKKNYTKEIFYRKYEYFADIFASAYGFGPSMYKNISREETNNNKFIDGLYSRGIYKIPFVKAMAIYSQYKRDRDLAMIDDHGEAYERASAMYTNLLNEIKTNSDLTPAQKKAIEIDLKIYKKIDEEYYEQNKKDGCLYKAYNKMLAKKITTKSDKVEDLILGPILEVAKENQ